MSGGSLPPCAGVVVLAQREGGDLECLLVQTHKGHWGFPKGKRHRGESVQETALRELEEETGIVAEQIALAPAFDPVDERSARGNLAVRYLLATLRAPAAELRRRPDEHQAVAWWEVNAALKRLRPSRQRVLEAAIRGLGG